MLLRDYPEVENEWGFTQADPRVLPVCVGEVESTGMRTLQFSEDHVADLVQRGKTRAIEIHAPAGSVVLFDMRPVHTGKGLVNSTRMSVANRRRIFACEGSAARRMRLPALRFNFDVAGHEHIQNIPVARPTRFPRRLHQGTHPPGLFDSQNHRQRRQICRARRAGGRLHAELRADVRVAGARAACLRVLYIAWRLGPVGLLINVCEVMLPYM